MRLTAPPRWLLLPLFAAALAVIVTACSSDSAPPVADDELTRHRYTVRGEIVTMPSPAEDLQIRHEAIPEFVNPDGSRGMNVMTMAFWPPITSASVSAEDPIIADAVRDFSLEGLAVGDKVSITFEVLTRTEKKKLEAYFATSVEKLPADTELDFTPLP